MVGDMFNGGLKAELNAIASELSAYLRANPAKGDPGSFMSDTKPGASSWWPVEFGSPSAVGAQNRYRYAVFPEKQRLVVDEDGELTVYDTGGHHISGVSQAQSGSASIVFSGSAGALRLSDFQRVTS